MWFLIIILCILIPYACIHCLASRLDHFAEANGFTNKIACSALVVGRTKLAAEVYGLLIEQKIGAVLEMEPIMSERDRNYDFLLALSENDVDNLLMSRIARKVWNTKKIAVICNDVQNERLFRKENISFLFGADTNAHMIVQTVFHKNSATQS